MVAIAKVEILEVEKYSNLAELLGYAIDIPETGEHKNTYTIDISGWVLGKKYPAVAIKIINNKRMLRKIPIGNPRPELARIYPQNPRATNCGFATSISIIGLSTEDELNLQAVLKDQTHIPIAKIRFRHQPLRSDYQPKLQPLIVTCVGRTGTTWLMQLLSQHPRLIICQHYPYEVRAAQYWMQMLQVLSQPANTQNSTPVVGFENELNLIGHNPFYNKKINSPKALDWHGNDYPEKLAAFCQESIDGFYQALGSNQGKNFSNSGQSIYFVEKYMLNPIKTLFLELYPQGREIILVRDFRDVVCSVIAFNAKRGHDMAGQQQAKTDEEIIREAGNFQAKMLLQRWKECSAKAFLLRYEDLILSPVETLTQLLEYLGLENSETTISSMLETASGDTKKMEKHRTTSSAEASIGRWKSDLNPGLQELCQQVFAEALQEFGYGKSGVAEY
ncbi:MAG: sulfotransferase [Cyanobacteriota bacterium]|nr:sulfotransferase [Cyanobacteriota bacterium]